MKAQTYFRICILMLIMILGSFSLVSAMDDPGFSISRLVASRNVESREPVGNGDVFSVASENIYCYLEARNIDEATTVSFVWYYESREMARVELPLQKGTRWRTWASKNTGGLKGAWRVDLLDSSGIVQSSVAFTVE